MKRIFILVLMVVLLLTLCGCDTISEVNDTSPESKVERSGFMESESKVEGAIDADGEKIGTLRYGVEGPSVVDDHDRMLTDKQFNSGQYWEFKWGYGIDGCFIDGYDVIKAPYSIGTSYGCRRLISAPSPDPQAQAC